MHKSITLARVARAVERSHQSLDNPGFCKACGKSADGCEPDARNYECESCGEAQVFGAEEIFIDAAYGE